MPLKIYRPMVQAIHFVSKDKLACDIIHQPDSGWKITAGVVNHQSALMTHFDTTACAGTEPLRLAQKR